MSSLSAAAAFAIWADVALASGIEPGSCPTTRTLANETTSNSVKTAARFLQIDFKGFSLGVNTALADSVRYAVDGQHVGCNAIVDAMGLCVAHHVFE